jgi:hypothetical protein
MNLTMFKVRVKQNLLYVNAKEEYFNSSFLMQLDYDPGKIELQAPIEDMFTRMAWVNNSIVEVEIFDSELDEYISWYTYEPPERVGINDTE